MAWVLNLNGDVLPGLNLTNVDNGPLPIFTASNLADGDHQLLGRVQVISQLAFAALDYFECVVSLISLRQEWLAEIFAADRIQNSSGGGIDLLDAGPNATNVPEDAVIVNDNSSEIIRSNNFQWFQLNDIEGYEQTFSATVTRGASLSYSFNGLAIWYGCVSHTPR